MAMAVPITPHRVAVLALEPVVGFDLTIPPTVLGEATTADGTRLYDVKICGLDKTPIHAGAGFSLVPDHGVEALAEADTVIIPGTYIPQPRHEGTLPDDLAAALATIRPGTRIASICTGAFVLAAAGLLDGRPATTHWRRADDFRALYPKVLLDEDLLFIDDGDIITSAGLAAGVDLCLHLVRRDFGSEVANRAARHCVVAPWRDGGQSQFIERVVPDEGTDGTAPTRAWALQHLARGDHPQRDGRAVRDERADLQSPLQGRDRAVAGKLALAATRPPRLPPAGDDRPLGRAGRRGGRVGHGRLASSSPPGRGRHPAARLPQDLPRELTRQRTTSSWGRWLTDSTPSSVTTTMSSIRAPHRPGW